jgi:hypothetical protein
MIYVASILLFLLAVVSVYALIKSKENAIVLFFLIPIILASSIYTGYSIYVLQGTPIHSLPQGKVELIWAEIQKPNIVFLVRHEDTSIPKYYRLPYTKENAKLLGNLSEQAEKGSPQTGEFKPPNKGGSITVNQDVSFDRIKREPLPPKKNALKLQGVDQGIINSIDNNQGFVRGEAPLNYSPK